MVTVMVLVLILWFPAQPSSRYICMFEVDLASLILTRKIDQNFA